MTGSVTDSHVLPTFCLFPFIMKTAFAWVKRRVLIPRKGIQQNASNCLVFLRVSETLKTVSNECPHLASGGPFLAGRTPSRKTVSFK